MSQKYDPESKRQFYLENRTRILQNKRMGGYAKEYYLKTKGRKKTKSQAKEFRKQYYLENRDHILAVSKIYQDNNRQKIREYNKQYYYSRKNIARQIILSDSVIGSPRNIVSFKNVPTIINLT